MLKRGQNCWRVEKANRAAMIVDAADYYRHALNAMLKAKSQIFVVGWDFDTRVKLAKRGPDPDIPVTIGPLFSWLTKKRPDLQIHVLAWGEGMFWVPGRGTTMFRLMRWRLDDQISMKWDNSHPLEASHHQKILVIDDCVGFCGGIDITAERWDTREHRDYEPFRKRPFTRRVYSPWHDASMAVDGPAARALGDLARLRWKICTGAELPDAEPKEDCWPDGLEPTFKDVPVAIARTRAEIGDYPEVREVEKLFLDLIKAAKSQVYIETQYFASRVIAEAIAERLQEPDGPEFVIINPVTGMTWLDEGVMGPARYELLRSLKSRDKHKRFRIYTPVTEGGAEIYVHAKVMIVDDLFLRVGSANVNNRSMGLDSECDLLVDGRRRKSDRDRIRMIRADLLGEHLGVAAEEVDQHLQRSGSLIATIEKLRGKGRTLRVLHPDKPGKVMSKVARTELLDPEAPGEFFEPRARPGLLTKLAR
jgi:phospholipase D1/2